MIIKKAAVRAMDTAQEFLRQKGVQVPEMFAVAGASKVRQYISVLFIIVLMLLACFIAWLDK